jgi:hypothetical protein
MSPLILRLYSRKNIRYNEIEYCARCDYPYTKTIVNTIECVDDYKGAELDFAAKTSVARRLVYLFPTYAHLLYNATSGIKIIKKEVMIVIMEYFVSTLLV